MHGWEHGWPKGLSTVSIPFVALRCPLVLNLTSTVWQVASPEPTIDVLSKTNNCAGEGRPLVARDKVSGALRQASYASSWDTWCRTPLMIPSSRRKPSLIKTAVLSQKTVSVARL